MSIAQTTTRFATVGLTCAATHNIILLAGDALGLHYAVSLVVSYAVVVLLGYGLHSRFTFRQAADAASFWRYALGMAANYPLTLLLLFLMCDVAGWPVAIAAPLATVLLFAANFLASRWAILRAPRAAEVRRT
jgi:putative flippase GtrA